jgi:cytidine deaminase
MTTSINDEDKALINAAKAAISAHHKGESHKLITAMQTVEGNIHYGINIQLDHIRRASACAESGAISSVVLAKETPNLSVSVYRDSGGTNDIVIANPCGLCREMLANFYPDLDVIIDDGGNLRKSNSNEFLPFKYREEPSI